MSTGDKAIWERKPTANAVVIRAFHIQSLRAGVR